MKMTELEISLPLYKNPNATEIQKLIARPQLQHGKLDSLIDDIYHKVEVEGDKALYEYCATFDKVVIPSIIIPDKNREEASLKIDMDLKKSIDRAYANIHRFHSAQKTQDLRVTTQAGVECWRESRPIKKVGLYIPGGSAPLFSTVLMLGVPAQIAGCDQVVLCTPPRSDGSIHPAIAYAAQLCGVHLIAQIGGAQAIAAMSCGTASIPQVDKIFGPGNQYVTAAKMRAQSSGIAIDLPAGPSEVLVFADKGANPSFIAADLLAQAEHGPDSQVVLVAQDPEIVQEVQLELNTQIKRLDRAEIACAALQHAYAVICSELTESFDFINTYAPEHLILLSDDPAPYIPMIQNAGSVFVGAFTPESAGDYASGTNHTLPTAGFAKAYSGVSLDSFVKKITFQEITKDGLKGIGPDVMTMAHHEQLGAHANAVQVRLDAL